MMGTACTRQKKEKKKEEKNFGRKPEEEQNKKKNVAACRFETPQRRERHALLIYFSSLLHFVFVFVCVCQNMAGGGP